MLIFEGLDKTGKTTIAKRVAAKLGWPYVHFGVPSCRVADYHATALAYGPKVVVDRLHWSEYAYGLTYRGQVGYTPFEWHTLEAALGSCGASIVLMKDSLRGIKSRWSSDDFDAKKIGELMDHFEFLQAGTSNPYRSRMRFVPTSLPEMLIPEKLDRLASEHWKLVNRWSR